MNIPGPQGSIAIPQGTQGIVNKILNIPGPQGSIAIPQGNQGILEEKRPVLQYYCISTSEQKRD
jgi:hypothetical protein